MLVSSKKFEFGIESAILLHLPQELVAKLHAVPLPPSTQEGSLGEPARTERRE